jgi:DNA-directed RNA polymerase alpha subunit
MENIEVNTGQIYSGEKEHATEKLIHSLKVNEVFSEVLRQSAVKMAEFTRQVDENNKIPNFGSKSAELIKNALQNFDNQVEESKNLANYHKKKTRARSYIRY